MIYVYLLLVFLIILTLYFSDEKVNRIKRQLEKQKSITKKNRKEPSYNYITRIRKSNQFVNIKSKFNKKLQDYPVIRQIREQYITRIAIIECISEKEATTKLENYLVTAGMIFIGTFAITFIFLQVIYLSFVISFSVFYLYLHRFNSKIKKGIHKIEQDFPEVIQAFFDEYIITKNSKNALLSVIDRGPEGSTKLVFEKLIREIYSGSSWEVAINDFSSSLNFFYAQAFAEILKLSLSEVGDVSAELNELMNIIQDDIEQKEQTKSTMHENKMMFYIINTVTLIVVVINIFVHPFAKEVYSYTATGSILFSIWLIQIIAGILFIEASENI